MSSFTWKIHLLCLEDLPVTFNLPPAGGHCAFVSCLDTGMYGRLNPLNPRLRQLFGALCSLGWELSRCGWRRNEIVPDLDTIRNIYQCWLIGFQNTFSNWETEYSGNTHSQLFKMSLNHKRSEGHRPFKEDWYTFQSDYLLMQQIFIEYVLCAKHQVRNWLR